jgi:Holliday junction resolvasome RuvABC DNA-binding subunit
MLPVARGGRHTEDNLITLCESHHLAHHAGALIIEGTTASTAVFKRRAHHTLATAERAVETATALKALGFDKREVKCAMDQTRTHVGTAELTLEQWIKIALRYCARPS